MCDEGHTFELKDFSLDDIDEDIVGFITYCQEMVSKSDHAGLLLECGARVVWVAFEPREEAERKFVFKGRKSEQLDLFENVEGENDENDPLTKLSEDVTLSPVADEGSS